MIPFSNRKMFFRVINYLLLVVLFLVASAIIIIYATGYKVDLDSKKISQTVTIEVNPVTSDADVYINGEIFGTGKTVKRGLNPGHYNIEVKKDGYHTWSREVDIAAGRAEVIEDPILFLENPVIEEFSLDGTADSLSKLTENDGLATSSGEIYQGNSLITRFQTDINGLCWYSDRKYVAFTQDGWLKIMGIDGTNIISLLQKSSSSVVVFVNSGRSVIFENEGKFFRAQIR